MSVPRPLPPSRRAYAWIRQRMAERIPGFSGDWPVWAWAKRPSWRRPRAGHVLLSAVVPAARVLWSDYELWHLPLNGGPIVEDEAAWDAWEASGACPAAAEATWPACLDLLRAGRGGWSAPSGMVQGCCDGLAWAEIRHVARAGAGLLDVCCSMEGAHGA